MGYEPAVLRRAAKRLEETRLRRAAQQERAQREIYAQLPRVAEIEAADKPRRKAPAMQDQPNPPGEADRRVREDLERMREFMRKQNSQEGK